MNTHQLDALADIYGWLIEWASEQEAAAGDNRQAEPAAATNKASEPAHGHYAPRPGATQTGD